MSGPRLLNRNTSILVLAQLVSVTGVVTLVTIGGIAGQRLASSPALATLPVAFMTIGTAVSTIAAAWLMSKVGRGRGFAAGALAGCLGYLVAVAAMVQGSFALFLLAAGLVGVAAAFSQQYRFAAIESVSKDAAGPAVSLVLAGSLGGAIAGPALAAGGENWLAAPFAGAFVVLSAAFLLLAGVLLRLRIEPPPATAIGGEARALKVITREPLFLLAVLGGVAGYAAMVLVMTATPVSMHVVDGHSLAESAAVVQAHVLAMYLPSLATGYLVARFGAGFVMAVGALVLALAVAAGFLGREVMHYAVAMIALGVGWNFLYVGGTVLLSLAHRPQERFQAQAVNDFSVFGVSAVGSLSAGAMMHWFGWHGVLSAALVPVVAVVVALAVVRPAHSIAPKLP